MVDRIAEQWAGFNAYSAGFGVHDPARQSRNQSGLPLEPQNIEQGRMNF